MTDGQQTGLTSGLLEEARAKLASSWSTSSVFDAPAEEAAAQEDAAVAEHLGDDSPEDRLRAALQDAPAGLAVEDGGV